MKMLKKTNIARVFFVAFIVAVFFMGGKEASAASSARLFQYTLLESVPGFFTGGTVMTDLPAMILAIY
ncbi:MAG: hypothetical protein HGA61_04420, partial [Candidatus Moranbacteria bacterium]|nr:hypothetical protein [Candidatus Moranbacteria bacterium]